MASWMKKAWPPLLCLWLAYPDILTLALTNLTPHAKATSSGQQRQSRVGHDVAIMGKNCCYVIVHAGLSSATGNSEAAVNIWRSSMDEFIQIPMENISNFSANCACWLWKTENVRTSTTPATNLNAHIEMTSLGNYLQVNDDHKKLFTNVKTTSQQLQVPPPKLNLQHVDRLVHCGRSVAFAAQFKMEEISIELVLFCFFT